MRMIDAERLREELLWRNVFLTDNEIDALVDLIDDQPTIPAPQWISVEDRLPEKREEVLIYLPKYDSVEAASFFTFPSLNLKEWAQGEDALRLDEVSHWMPMPEPPKEDVQ